MSIYFEFSTGKTFKTKAALKAFIRNGCKTTKTEEAVAEDVKPEKVIEKPVEVKEPVKEEQGTEETIENVDTEDDDVVRSVKEVRYEQYKGFSEQDMRDQLDAWGIDKRRFSKREGDSLKELFYEVAEDFTLA